MHENTAPVIVVQQYLEVGAHSRVVTDARAASWRPLHDHRQLPKLLRELEPQLITGFLRCCFGCRRGSTLNDLLRHPYFLPEERVQIPNTGYIITLQVQERKGTVP